MRHDTVDRALIAQQPPCSDDPRGPFREIVAVEYTPDTALVSLNCGHVAECNPIYAYKVAKELRCFQCGPSGAQRRELALSERPVSWLVERHALLVIMRRDQLDWSENVPAGEIAALRMEIESIEDELIDRDLMHQLERTRQLEPELYERARAIIQRGSNR